MFELIIHDGDLHFGKRCNEVECPVALAMRRLVNYSVVVSVGVTHITLRRRRDGEHLLDYKMSKKLQQFINTFDRGQPVKEGRFRVNGDIPKWYRAEANPGKG
jgi:hypothetical protein